MSIGCVESIGSFICFLHNSTSAAIRQTEYLVHKEERRIYDNHQTMEDALKFIIIDAVDEVYIGKLWNKYTGYLVITSRDLLDHLLDRYGNITPADVEECKHI